MKGFLFVFCVSFASIISVSHSLHFCESLAANSGPAFGIGLSVPMNGPINKNYLIIKDQYWELVFDNNSANPSPLTFSDKESKYIKWFGETNYNLAFAVRFGHPWDDVWNSTSIGLINFETESFSWALFPEDMSNGLEPTGNVNSGTFRFTPQANDSAALRPNIAYGTYSRRQQNSIVFIEQKMSATTGQYELRIQGYNSTDPGIRFDNETNSPWFQPPAKQPPPLGQWIVPTAVKETNRSLYIAALYGLSTNNGTNGTIILFAKNLIFSYCITDEYYLWPECLSNNMSILIDCNLEPITTTTTAMPTVTETPTPSVTAIDGSSTVSTDNGGGGTSGGGNTVSNQTPSATSKVESGGSTWWIYLLIVFFILIIIIVVMVFFVMKGNQTSEAPKKAGDGGVDAGAGEAGVGGAGVGVADVGGAGVGGAGVGGAAVGGADADAAVAAPNSNVEPTLRSNI